MGWNECSTRQGIDTYMADQVGRAGSGFDALEYNRVQAGTDPAASNPLVLIATDDFAWGVFRWGDYSTLTPYPDADTDRAVFRHRDPVRGPGAVAGRGRAALRRAGPAGAARCSGGCSAQATSAGWRSEQAGAAASMAAACATPSGRDSRKPCA
jgi:hypothetical protein